MYRIKTFILAFVFLACEGVVEAQWVQTDGPYGGPMIDVVGHGSDVFASSDSGTVYQLSADGKQWQKTAGVLPKTHVRALAARAGYLFAGLYDGGFYRSSDKGQSWTLMTTAIGSHSLNTIEVSGEDVYAATQERLYRSTDDGLTWTNAGLQIGFDNSGLHVIENDLYALGHFRGYWRSTDRGQSWTYYEVEKSRERVVGIVRLGDSIVAATLDGVFVRVGNSDVWRRASLPFIGALPSAIIAVGDTVVMACAEWGVFYSIDLGATWTKSSMNRWMPSPIINFALSETQLFATCETGIITSTDRGVSWNPLNRGLWRARVVSITETDRYVLAATYLDGVFRSSDEGVAWQQTSHNWTTPGWVTALYAMANSGGTLVVTGSVSGILRSTDDGTTWPGSTIEDPILFSLFPRGTELFGGSWYKGVYRSLDAGLSWESYHNGDSTWTINALTADDSTLYISSITSPFLFHRHDSASTGHDVLSRHYRSTDTTKQDSTSMNTNWWSLPIPDTPISILSIAIRDSILFAAVENNELHQLNLHSGEWTSIASERLAPNVVALAVIDSSILAASENHGIYLSDDNGLTWSSVSDSTGPTGITCLFVGRNNLYVGTRTKGVWHRGLSEIIIPVTVQSQGHHQPLTLKAHPNPFDSRTTVSFTVDRAGPVTLNIFNIQGELVANLFSGHLETSSKSVDWNVMGLTRGLYYVQLQTGGGSRATVLHLLN